MVTHLLIKTLSCQNNWQCAHFLEVNSDKLQLNALLVLQEFTPIGSTHNRSARPFPGFGGSSGGGSGGGVAAPVAMRPQQSASPQYNATYNSAPTPQQYNQPPTQPYGQPNTQDYNQSYTQQQPTAQSYGQQSTQEYSQPGLGSNMARQDLLFNSNSTYTT